MEDEGGGGGGGGQSGGRKGAGVGGGFGRKQSSNLADKEAFVSTCAVAARRSREPM